MKEKKKGEQFVAEWNHEKHAVNKVGLTNNPELEKWLADVDFLIRTTEAE